MYFPHLSTDDRTDFELNVSGDDLIVLKHQQEILRVLLKKM